MPVPIVIGAVQLGASLIKPLIGLFQGHDHWNREVLPVIIQNSLANNCITLVAWFGSIQGVDQLGNPITVGHADLIPDYFALCQKVADESKVRVDALECITGIEDLAAGRCHFRTFTPPLAESLLGGGGLQSLNEAAKKITGNPLLLGGLAVGAWFLFK